METARATPLAPGATTLTRALSVLILLLMVAAAAYGASIAFRSYRQIGV